MLKLRLELAVALHLRRVCEIGLKFGHLRFDLRESRNAPEGILEKCLVGSVWRGILARKANARASFNYEFAGIRSHLAENYLEERRLARAVWPDYADAIARVDAERHVRQDVLMSIVDANSLEI